MLENSQSMEQWVWLQKKMDVQKSSVESWQANSICIQPDSKRYACSYHEGIYVE